jgi:peptide deformylase
MLKTMYASKGIGLSAPQVGMLNRMFVMDCGDNPCVFINPIITHKSKETVQSREGCLSFPGFLVEVKRHAEVTVHFHGLDGNKYDIVLEGIEAICAQHEIDHLEGKVFLRYLSKFHRNMIEKQMKRRKL